MTPADHPDAAVPVIGWRDPDTRWLAEPGVYDLPAEVYHADPVPAGSLSSTGARKLLPPSCPALYRHWRDHGQEPQSHFDLGHAAHLLILGDSGPELVVVDADDWRTKKAKEAAAEARSTGAIPLLEQEFDQVQAMASALRRDPLAVALLSGNGQVEQSLFWRDADTEVWCRARPDWMTGGYLADYKTTTDAHPRAVARAIATYGYHIQAAHYLTGAAALDLVGADAPFFMIFQAKAAPHLVTVVELDDEALRIGHAAAAAACRIYADCVRTDRWPGYSDDIELISLPAYARREEYL